MMIGPGVSFDAARRRVCDADGTPLHLTPKAFDLLQILIIDAPRVVHKSELHSRLWPDTFVTDAALTALVKELRRVLRDRDRQPPLIKTAHGIGYAFDAALTEASSDAPAHAPNGVHWLVSSARRYALETGDNVIGRDPAAAVWLDQVDVSRRHARVVVSGERAVIEDLESKNGTMVGACRLTAPHELADGDHIRVGGVYLTYRRDNDGSTQTALSE